VYGNVQRIEASFIAEQVRGPDKLIGRFCVCPNDNVPE